MSSQNVKHVEVFFDPQTHTERGVSFSTLINGIYKALQKGEEELGVSFLLIMSYLRYLSEEAVFETLEQSKPFHEFIDGIGLDSSEVGNPPEKFERVFKASAELGYKLCAHAGEEGPAEYIWGFLNVLKVDRIDHGNRCLDDEKLVKHLSDIQIPLTLCPLSNLELKVIKDLKEYPLRIMMEHNLLVTINSDDPAYFDGYINENFIATAEALELSLEEIVTLLKNGFQATWLDEDEKLGRCEMIDELAEDLK